MNTKKTNGKTGIVFVADHWGRVSGGIDVFNEHLCRKMAHVVEEDTVSVICLVFGDLKTRQIWEEKELSSVDLIQYSFDSSESDEDKYKSALKEVLQKVPCEKYIWVGHDLITGNMALELSKLNGRKDRCAVILHTDYFTTQAGQPSRSGIRGEGCDGDSKNDEQEKLANQADWTFCVGPILYQRFKNIHDTHLIIPGLDINNRKEKSGEYNQIITAGRFNKQSEYQKKWKEVCFGIGKAIDLMIKKGHSALDYTVVIFGFSRDYKQNELKELAKTISEEIGRNTENHVQITPKMYYFDDKQQDYLNCLSKSKVFVMSSWVESFGLVAWEAIEMGIPVVVSQNTGIYVYMEEELGYLLRGLCGSFKGGTQNSVDAMALAIADILSGGKVEESAERLRREMLKLNRWEKLAINMAETFGIREVMSSAVYMDSPYIEFTYAKREMLLIELKRRVQSKKICDKIVFFDGISTQNILDDDNFLLHLMELLCAEDRKNVQVYLAYPNSKAIGERITQIDKGSVDEEKLRNKSGRVSELKAAIDLIWERGEIHVSESDYRAALQRIHLVPLDKSPTVYINILDSEWYYTNRYEKRASENSAMKLQLDGSDEGTRQKKNLIDYMKFILNASPEDPECQLMLEQVEKW